MALTKEELERHLRTVALNHAKLLLHDSDVRDLAASAYQQRFGDTAATGDRGLAVLTDWICAEVIVLLPEALNRINTGLDK